MQVLLVETLAGSVLCLHSPHVYALCDMYVVVALIVVLESFSILLSFCLCRY